MTPDYRAGLLRGAAIARERIGLWGRERASEAHVIAEAIEREASQPATVPDSREKCGKPTPIGGDAALGSNVRLEWSQCRLTRGHAGACNGTGTAGDKP